MGEMNLSKWNYGIEVTRGTPVAASRRLFADIAPLPQHRRWEFFKYANGRRTKFNAKRNDALLVQNSVKITNGYFQLMPALTLCTIDGVITPTEKTIGQGDWEYAGVPLLNSANAPKTLTIEGGDDTQAFEMEYCMGQSIKYAGKIAQDGASSPVSVEWGYFARQVTPVSFTADGSLTAFIPTEMNAKLARLYLDTTWAGVGTTEIVNTLRGFEVEIIADNHPKFFGSGLRTFDSYGEGDIEVLVTLDLEGNASADAIYDLCDAGTERALQLTINGPTIGSGQAHSLVLKVFGAFDLVTPISSSDRGNNLHKALFRGVEDGSGNYMSLTTVTNMATAG